MDLGAPIGSHGAGHGVGGGHGIATSQNTQSGGLARQDGFNSGVGGNHASGDIPRGTPIADKFSSSGSGNTPNVYGQNSSSGGRGLGGDKLDNSLDNFDGERSYGQSGRGETVSGAYSGGSTGDALTGQTGHSTGAGVGPLAENLRGSSGEHHHHHHSHSGAAAGVGAGAGAVAGGIAGHKEYEQAYGHSNAQATSAAPLTRGEGVAGLGQGLVPGVGGGDGSSGIGPAGGDGAYTESRREPGYGNSGSGGAGAAGLGAGAAGVGAGELYSSSRGNNNSNQDYNNDYNNNNQGSSGNGAKIAEGGLSGSGGNGVNEPGTGGGKYGRAEHDSSAGKPLSDPKDLDTGNPHSLVYDEASGKYVHRRDLTGGNHSSRA